MVAQVRRLTAGPFVGMRDSLDPEVSSEPQFARVLQNVYPLDRSGPSVFVSRAGLEQHNANGRLGDQTSASFPWTAHTGQLVHHFVREDGEERTMVVVGGHLYGVLSWEAGTYVEISAGGVSWDQTARYYAVTFGDIVVYHDGTNNARTKDPINFNGQELTNAPVLFGQPVVYYAKLFAIKASERGVIVWSEEADPTIGYETSPYSNSWSIGQKDQAPLYALASTNAELFFFRARSIGSVRGAVTADFTTDGTHDGVSQTVGTISPDGVCVVGEKGSEKVFFIDADARPHVIVGGQLKPIYENITETIATLDKEHLDKAWTRFDPASGLVLYGVVEIGQSQPSLVLGVNPVTDLPCTLWRFSGNTIPAIGVARNADSLPVLLHLSVDGFAYAHEPGLTDDAFNAGTVPVAHVAETCFLGVDARDEKRFSRTDITLRVEEALTGLDVKHITPYGTSTAVTGSVSGPSGAVFGSAIFGQSSFPSGVSGRKLPVGLKQTGRWIRHRIEHAETGEGFGIAAFSTEYVPAGDGVQAA